MQKSDPPPALYGIDAGGSRTIVTVVRPGEAPARWERGSFAIATAGADEASRCLRDLLLEIAALVGDDGPAVGCVASSAMPFGDEAPAPQLLIDALLENAPAGWVGLVNDVIPLLWTTHLQGMGLAVSSGTGSSVIGRGADGQLLKVGGHEYIISDEGSAYSLAREGLRSAARAADGIGEATSLRYAAEAFFERPTSAIGRWLAEMPRARRTVAAFAPEVTTAAEAGDLVAQRIVATDADRLVDAAQFAAGQLGLPSLSPIGLAGGVFWGSALFRERVQNTLHRRGLTDSTRRNIQLLEGQQSTLGFARILADLVAEDSKPEPPSGLLLHVT
ncbi:BadF/BadG/BcrA/BcrD ATPase family protein [Acidothermaceae bacterium B102]|nr:BadF/BadG/BcrA/BcrD ATPase family protein [Acidothermaceae bacterium B102]